MAEGVGGRAVVLAEFVAGGIHGVLLETSGEGGWHFENDIDPRAKWSMHPVSDGIIEDSPAIAPDHRVKLRDTLSTANATKRRGGHLPGFLVVEFEGGIQALEAIERATGQAGSVHVGGDEFPFLGAGGGAAGFDLGNPVEFIFWEPNEEIDAERQGDLLIPNGSQSLTGEPEGEFIQQETKRARVVSLRCSGWPVCLLRGEAGGGSGVVKYGNVSLWRGQSGLVGKQLAQGGGVAEFRPDVGNLRFQIQPGAVPKPEQGGGGGSFGGGPDGDDGIRFPLALDPINFAQRPPNDEAEPSILQGGGEVIGGGFESGEIHAFVVIGD